MNFAPNFMHQEPPQKKNDCPNCGGYGSVPIDETRPMEFDLYRDAGTYVLYNAKKCPVCNPVNK